VLDFFIKVVWRILHDHEISNFTKYSKEKKRWGGAHQGKNGDIRYRHH